LEEVAVILGGGCLSIQTGIMADVALKLVHHLNLASAFATMQ
jgi:hypothetical protein